MDIQDEQDKNRRSSSVTFSFIGGAPQAHGVSYINGTWIFRMNRIKIGVHPALHFHSFHGVSYINGTWIFRMNIGVHPLHFHSLVERRRRMASPI
jgi:hypothetical protein